MGYAALRARLRARFELGQHPLRFTGQTVRDAAAMELAFESADGERITGLMLRPEMGERLPAVVVIHAHGNRYEIGARELIEGRPSQPSPIGPALLERGIATVCIDMPCFGGRAGVTEQAAAKAALWRGRSLAGQMLGELSSLLDWMSSEPWIDSRRIGIYGLSMGATLGYWLSAADERVAALAQLCCLADLDALMATGAHDLHGIYLSVPGLPGLARNGVIAGLVAPRPQLVCLGAQDPLTPPDAMEIALTDLREGYAQVPAALHILVDRESSHRETPEMRARVLEFFGRHLA